MEKAKSSNLESILDRTCVSADKSTVYIVNMTVFGSAPTVAVFDSIESLTALMSENPGLSVSIISVAHYV